MTRRVVWVCICFLGWGAAWACAQQKTWEYTGQGQWAQVPQPASKSSAQPIANPALDHVEQLLNSGHGHLAHDQALSWVKSHTSAPDHDRGLFLLAESYFMNGDRMWCFYECDEMLDKHPDSRLFAAALELQYRVADAFLNGYKKKFLGLPILTMEDEAIEMLFRIQERAPGSPIAEKALLRTADYYYHTSQFDLATDAYAAYARNFSRSPEVPRVRLQEAFATLAQFRGPRYDATPLIDARAMFREIIERYPDLAREENLPEFIERIDNTLATKLYLTADFYRRTNQPHAAVFLYRMLLKTYPQSRDAGLAQNELRKMPAWALAESAPPPAVFPAPSTQPDVPVNPVLPPAPSSGQRLESR